MTTDEKAKELYEKNAKGWNAPPWEELHDQTKDFWRIEAIKRAGAPGGDGDS